MLLVRLASSRHQRLHLRLLTCNQEDAEKIFLQGLEIVKELRVKSADGIKAVTAANDAEGMSQGALNILAGKMAAEDPVPPGEEMDIEKTSAAGAGAGDSAADAGGDGAANGGDGAVAG